MATGAIGGVPTTTARNFAFGSSVSNFIFYTCPSNTISYVNLRFAETNGSFFGNQITQLGVSYTTGYVGTQYKNMLFQPISGFGAGWNIPIMGTAAAFAYHIPATNATWTSGVEQIDNPYSKRMLVTSLGPNPADFVCGTLILYPAQSLFVTTASFTGGIINIIYDTLEVTAGA